MLSSLWTAGLKSLLYSLGQLSRALLAALLISSIKIQAHSRSTLSKTRETNLSLVLIAQASPTWKEHQALLGALLLKTSLSISNYRKTRRFVATQTHSNITSNKSPTCTTCSSQTSQLLLRETSIMELVQLPVFYCKMVDLVSKLQWPQESD